MLLKPPGEALPPLQLDSPDRLPCPALLEADAGAQEPPPKALTRGSCIAVQASCKFQACDPTCLFLVGEVQCKWASDEIRSLRLAPDGQRQCWCAEGSTCEDALMYALLPSVVVP